jgi:hypothetical protein
MGRHVAPRGCIVASVLNPFFWQDSVRPAWWRPCLRGLLSGAVVYPGTAVPCYRHLVSSLRSSAAPHFTLAQRAGAGALIRYGHGPRTWEATRSAGERIEARLWRRWPLAACGKFLFLVFRKAV